MNNSKKAGQNHTKPATPLLIPGCACRDSAQAPFSHFAFCLLPLRNGPVTAGEDLGGVRPSSGAAMLESDSDE